MSTKITAPTTTTTTKISINWPPCRLCVSVCPTVLVPVLTRVHPLQSARPPRRVCLPPTLTLRRVNSRPWGSILQRRPMRVSATRSPPRRIEKKRPVTLFISTSQFVNCNYKDTTTNWLFTHPWGHHVPCSFVRWFVGSCSIPVVTLFYRWPSIRNAGRLSVHPPVCHVGWLLFN